MFNILFWWTGALTWSVLAGLAAWIVIEFLIGLVAACSWLRWQLAMVHKYNETRDWWKLPGAFLRIWWSLAGWRPGSVEIRSKNGRWDGICDWQVY